MTSAQVKIGGSIALTLVVFDEIIKFFALRHLPKTGGVFDSKIFDIHLHLNTGIAFDLPLPLSLTVLLTFIIIIILGTIFVRQKNINPQLSIAILFILSGAIGNLFDRLVYGFVIDYVLIFGRSLINISDLMIIGGVIAILFARARKSRRPETGDQRQS